MNKKHQVVLAVIILLLTTVFLRKQINNSFAQSPIAIHDCRELQSIETETKLFNGNYVLANDLDCKGISFMPIGSSQPFTGSFNGDGFEIWNLNISAMSSNGGLFGTIDGGKVFNLNVVNISIKPVNAFNNTGSIAGQMIHGGTIDRVVVRTKLYGALDKAGGLVGSMNDSMITNSSAEVSITLPNSGYTDSQVGGLVGFMSNSHIKQSFARGGISSSFNSSIVSSVGGLVGRSALRSTIDESFASGAVIGYEVGGLVGVNQGGSEIRNSFAHVNVTGYGKSGHAGGLVGVNNLAKIFSSYAAGRVVNRSIYKPGGIIGNNLNTDLYAKQNSYHVFDNVYFDASLANNIFAVGEGHPFYGSVITLGNTKFNLGSTRNEIIQKLVSSNSSIWYDPKNGKEGPLLKFAYVYTPVCGDGKREGKEACDDGKSCNDMQRTDCTTNADICTGPGNYCATRRGDGCDAQCRIEQNWQCTGGLGQRSVCTYTPPLVCGDGKISVGEVCDDGALNGRPNQCNNTCTGQTASSCGNGVIEAPEACDDGALNGRPNQCNNTCTGQTASSCGNGVIEAPEACDDGNAIDTDGCTNNCTVARCGDGICSNSETCNGCTADCGCTTGEFCTLPAENLGVPMTEYACRQCADPVKQCGRECSACPPPPPVTFELPGDAVPAEIHAVNLGNDQQRYTIKWQTEVDARNYAVYYLVSSNCPFSFASIANLTNTNYGGPVKDSSEISVRSINSTNPNHGSQNEIVICPADYTSGVCSDKINLPDLATMFSNNQKELDCLANNEIKDLENTLFVDTGLANYHQFAVRKLK